MNDDTNELGSRAPGFLVSAPEVSLPKGGGAIRGVGEKFAANPVTGSASFAIPLPASPGRAGVSPQLALRYDSASGNGPFGFGWNLGLPAITRKTDKGLPRYGDATDIFVLAGVEDLVPVLTAGGAIDDDSTSVADHVIRRFRPRIEGQFARIERWTRNDGDVHWRVISPDNVRTIYGRIDAHRIVDPADRSRVFSWLISETLDDKGNAVVYDYAPEDGTDLDVTQTHERSRGAAADPSRTANRYITRIRYGNVPTMLDDATLRRPSMVSQASIDATRWMFELAFDYGTADPLSPDVIGAWTRRGDPFSSYRSGFEVRTYRLCRRVLMFHDFPGDPSVGARCLVRSLDLTYRMTPQDEDSSDPGYSFLERATQWSYQNHDGVWERRALPPLEFTYSEPAIDETVRVADASAVENLPVGLNAPYRWIDLDGEGLSGILTEQAGAWYYKRSLGDSPSGPRFGPVHTLTFQPSVASLEARRQQLMDVQGNGALDLVDFDTPLAGFHERDQHQGWTSFVPFSALPNVDWGDRNLRFLDLTGDGHADALMTEQDVFTWYPSQGAEGFGVAERHWLPLDERDGPRVVFADAEQAVYLADMSGDGLTDIVRVRNGEVSYWPNLGYGSFGKQIVMDGSPWFDHPDQFDQRRIRLADIDGSGTVDLIYLGPEDTTVWFNRSGNAWSASRRLPFPIANGSTDAIQVADLLGNGTACLVWSSDLPVDSQQSLRFVDLMGGRKPHLMVEMRNSLGAITSVDYIASTMFYVRDREAGTPWVSKLPFPVHCVARVSVTDSFRRTTFVTSYSYHHGYFDGTEREFRGFGRVEQIDTQRFDAVAHLNRNSPFVTSDERLYQPPVKTITWFHVGLARERSRILGLYEREYFPARYAARLAPGAFQERRVPQPDVEFSGPPLDPIEWREAMRACKGLVLRQEVIELDLGALHDRDEHVPVRLYSAAQHNCRIRRVQRRGSNPHAVFLVTEGEALTYHYELALSGTQNLNPDPRIAHTLNLRVDPYGRAQQSIATVYARAGQHSDNALSVEQLALIRAVQNDERHVVYTEQRFTDELQPPDVDTHRIPAPCDQRTFELTGVSPAAGSEYFSINRLRDFRFNVALDTQANLPVTELDYHEQPPDNTPHQRLVERVVTLYFEDDLSGALPFAQPPPRDRFRNLQAGADRCADRRRPETRPRRG
jgi:hypothetical protein